MTHSDFCVQCVPSQEGERVPSQEGERVHRTLKPFLYSITYCALPDPSLFDYSQEALNA